MRLVTPLCADSETGGIVVFFPHAGGSPRFFTHLAMAMPHCRVFGVTYPGRDHLIDAAPLTEMTTLAMRIAHELVARFSDESGPLTLVGHSLGAFVAYETAAVLGTFLDPVRTTVVVSGQNPPLADRSADLSVPRTDDEIVADVIRQNPATAPIWGNVELREFFLPIVRADYQLLNAYQFSKTRIEKVKVVIGDQDTEVDPSRVAGWQQVSNQPVEISVVSGGHFYLDSPDVQLAQELLRMPALKPMPEGGRIHG